MPESDQIHLPPMTDNQIILKKVENLETMAYAIIEECQQTRKLIEADVSTPTNTGISAIAEEARRNLRARLLTSKK